MATKPSPLLLLVFMLCCFFNPRMETASHHWRSHWTHSSGVKQPTAAQPALSSVMMYPSGPSEIQDFLSEEECRVVVQLAQLKGLMESHSTAARRGQEDSSQPLLQLSTQEVFSLLDLNQDGLLQKQEVTGSGEAGWTF